jgi:hypothetical protein
MVGLVCLHDRTVRDVSVIAVASGKTRRGGEANARNGH